MQLRGSRQYEFSMKQIFTVHITNWVIHFSIKLNFPTEGMNCVCTWQSTAYKYKRCFIGVMAAFFFDQKKKVCSSLSDVKSECKLSGNLILVYYLLIFFLAWLKLL